MWGKGWSEAKESRINLRVVYSKQAVRKKTTVRKNGNSLMQHISSIPPDPVGVAIECWKLSRFFASAEISLTSPNPV